MLQHECLSRTSLVSFALVPVSRGLRNIAAAGRGFTHHNETALIGVSERCIQQ
jgi:hypothetical protein